MPEVAVKTRDQTAADQIQFILRQDWFQPETLKKYIAALKNWQPNQLSVIIDGQITSYNRIVADLQQFLRSLPPNRRQNLAADSLAPDQLNLLDSIIDEVAGSAATAEVEKHASPNTPPNLKELTQIYQSAIEAKAKRENLTKPQIDEYIAKQITPVIIQTGVVKQAAKIQFEFVIDNSQYLENLATAIGRRPEVVKRLAKMRLDQIIDKTITTQALIQARSISVDTSQLTSMFVRNLQKGFDLDDLVGPAVRTNRQNAKKAIESVKKTVTDETAKAKPAIETAAETLQQHPTVAAAARRAAQEAVKQAKPDIPPAKAARLNTQLVKHQNNPDVQEKLIAKTFNIPPSQAKLVLNSLHPSLSQLAASTPKLNPLLAANPDSIAADALHRPNLFPKPFVDALKSGKITDAQVAEIFHIARLLDVPPNAVILSRFGVNAQNLAVRLQQTPKFLGFIPMGRGLDPKDATIAKLSDLAADQRRFEQQLTKSVESPPPELPTQIPEQFLKTSRAAARANRFSQFFDQINPFRLPSALSYNLGRTPPLGSIGNSGSAFVSGLRIQSGPINSFFNFISSAGNAVRQAPSFLTAPFRAVGSAISNTIINPVKTWAGTQIKSGLAKAGAWLAKKGITEGAKKLGLALIGKGTAALLAQAAPVVGQIASILMLLSTLGDIGKFLWQNRKTIGLTLGGLFFLGQILLGKILTFLGSAAWTLGGAALGFALGGPFGAIVGGTIGWLIGSGALGSIISGLGSALGSAAASLGSFIGAITAPSAVAGLGSTVAAVGLLGVVLAWAIQTFFIQPNVNSALFVPTGPGGPIPPDFVVAGTCPLVEDPYISTGSLGSGFGTKEHGGVDYSTSHCYGIPIRGMWVWEDNQTPKPGCSAQSVGTCNQLACPFYGFATDVKSSSSDNPTIRLPLICSKTEASTSCGPMTWRVIDHFYNCRGGSTNTKEECEAKEFVDNNGNPLPKWEQLWGWGTIFESNDNGHYWRLYLNHYEPTVSIAPGNTFQATELQSSVIGIIPAGAYVQHLHYELVVDNAPVRPDYLCSGE